MYDFEMRMPREQRRWVDARARALHVSAAFIMRALIQNAMKAKEISLQINKTGDTGKETK